MLLKSASILPHTWLVLFPKKVHYYCKGEDCVKLRSDWIIGSPDIVVTTQEDMYNLLIHNQKRPVKLLVFNSDEDAVREVTVVPDFGWGGDGCVGFDVASGALHRIPEESQINKPPQTEVISELQ